MGAEFLKFFYKPVRWGFPVIIYIRLIGKSKNQYLCPFQRFTNVI